MGSKDLTKLSVHALEELHDHLWIERHRWPSISEPAASMTIQRIDEELKRRREESKEDSR